jgi:uncharacterized protein (TIGR02145 family)
MQFCTGSNIYEKCGGNSYDLVKQFCYKNNTYEKCNGNNIYVPSTHFCAVDNKVCAKCGGNEYDTAKQFCYENNTYEKCSGKEYDPTKQNCCNKVAPYNTLTEFCAIDNKAYEKCGGKEYDPAKQSCCNKDALYNTSTQFCTGNNIYEKCGGNTYIPSTQFCSIDNNIKDGGEFTDFRDGQKYKYAKIGNQIWMAQNLNYNTTDSRCYDNKPENCVKYGRLYNWTTATNLPSSKMCWSMYCKDLIYPKHNGICPYGWHLPAKEEWETLVNLVGSNSIKLKAKSGWNNNGNGTNDYGFSALPGGYTFGMYFDGKDHTFKDVGTYGTWLSSTEVNINPNASYHWSMNDKSNEFSGSLDDKYNSYKVNFRSVRCVKD